MKKNFTFILLSLLLFVVGGAKSQTALELNGGNIVGNNVDLPSGDHSTSGTIQFKDKRAQYSYVTNGDWVDATAGTHTFEITLGSSGNQDCTLHIAALKEVVSGSIFDNGSIKAAAIIQEESITVTNNATLTLSVSSGYSAIILWQTSNTDWRKVNIASFTRTVTGAAPSVAAPTISPASGTYDGDLSVTITPGEGNDHVIYSVDGSNEDSSQTINSETTINLTGDGTITVTATGYDSGNNPSSTVTNTYTYGVPSGKTTVSYAIPGEVETEMRKYDFESGDDTEQGGSFSGKGQSGDDSYAGSHNLWLKNDNYGGQDYSSQIYLNLNTSDWPVGTKITLSFYAKGCDDFEVNTDTKEGRDNGMKIAIQEKDSPWRDCAVFTNGVKITKEWDHYEYQTTIDNTCSPNRIYFNCGNYKGSFRFDNIIITKTAESATGGSNVFTSDDQVANIDKSEFSSLKEGDYICAAVTGSPKTIKLVCNGKDYALSQFNGGNLWGVKATADMVTALSGNDSEFKGHDLTLNGISIYETTAVTETNTGSITKKNNTFVELTRSFTKDMWNTVCLPFALTADQADELFGSGYKIAKFTGVSETTMEFTSKDKEAFVFVAGQPYLVKPTEDLSNSSPVVLADVNITAKNGATVTHGDVTHGDYSFTGTFTTKSFAKGDWATTRFVANDNKLNTPNKPNPMKALRCYFTVPAESLARGYAIDGFMDDDVPTDISATLNDNVQTTKVIYNLAGQRVANPTKGLYIVNGQKVVVK